MAARDLRSGLFRDLTAFRVRVWGLSLRREGGVWGRRESLGFGEGVVVGRMDLEDEAMSMLAMAMAFSFFFCW